MSDRLGGSMTHLFRLLAVVLVVSAVPVLGAVAAEAGPAPRADATKVHRVSPLDAEGNLRSGYDVTATGKGYCWTTSMIDGRLYRCMQHNAIHDPCWKESGRRSVVCLTDPWTRNVFRLKLTKPLPDASDYGPGVWGLKRADGVGGHCIISSGAGSSVHGRPISYYCRKGWVLVGSIDRSEPTWTIRTARRVGHHYESRGRKPLSKAWKPVLHLSGG